MPTRDLDDANTPQRFVNATLEIWEKAGAAGLSVRLLAHHAGAPPSSLYHHFGQLEHLYLAALDHATRCAREWCADRLSLVTKADGLARTSLPAILAATIDDWTRDCRRLAIAWWECQLLAARDARYLPALRAFNLIWRGFWDEACRQAGAPDAGELTSLFFVGESRLHLMRWDRLVDRAALDENSQGWLRWLDGQSSGDGPWRRLARDMALQAAPDLGTISETAGRIADAAADVVEQNGMVALTHRAVAAQAGLTLGVVSYNFKSSADLARAAFEAIYRRATPSPQRLPEQPLFSPAEAWDLLLTLGERGTSRLVALDELMIATARDPDLAEFVPQLRYLRGRTSGQLLETLLGDRFGSALDAAIFSSFISGQRQMSFGLAPPEARAFSERTLRALPPFAALSAV